MSDLGSAYLQLKEKQHQLECNFVCHQGRSYASTRLGFCWNCAQDIVSAVSRQVLSPDSDIKTATRKRIDDNIVIVHGAGLQREACHLHKYG